MTIQREIAATMRQERDSDSFALNIVFREIKEEEDSGKYWVTECLEILGCISQGDSQEEAEKTLKTPYAFVSVFYSKTA